MTDHKEMIAQKDALNMLGALRDALAGAALEAEDFEAIIAAERAEVLSLRRKLESAKEALYSASACDLPDMVQLQVLGALAKLEGNK